MNTVLFVNGRDEVLLTHDAALPAEPSRLLWHAAGRRLVAESRAGSFELGRDIADELASALERAQQVLLVRLEAGEAKSGRAVPLARVSLA